MNALMERNLFVYRGLTWASLVFQMVKNQPAMWEIWVWSLGWEDPLEEGTATHSSIHVWRISTDRGAWRATVHGVAKSQTWLSEWPSTAQGTHCIENSGHKPFLKTFKILFYHFLIFSMKVMKISIIIRFYFPFYVSFSDCILKVDFYSCNLKITPGHLDFNYEKGFKLLFLFHTHNFSLISLQFKIKIFWYLSLYLRTNPYQIVLFCFPFYVTIGLSITLVTFLSAIFTKKRFMFVQYCECNGGSVSFRENCLYYFSLRQCEHFYFLEFRCDIWRKRWPWKV